MSKDSVSDWSTTASSNTDVAGTDISGSGNVSQGDDAMRAIMAQIASYTRRGSDLASASTLNLDSVDSLYLNVTGTTTVTAVTLTSGHIRIARAVAAFQLTASSSLIVNGSQSVNYTTVADDYLLFEGYGSSVVRVTLLNSSRAVLGLATTDSPQFTAINLNHASANTVTASGGIMSVEGVNVMMGTTGSTDNRLLRADGTGTATMQSSAITVDDSGNMSGVGTIGSGAITMTGTLTLSSSSKLLMNSSAAFGTLTSAAELIYNSTNGLMMGGGGSVNDFDLVNKSGSTVLSLPTGTTDLYLPSPGNGPYSVVNTQATQTLGNKTNQAASGTVSAPAYSFASNTDMGFFREASVAERIAVTVDNAQVGYFNSSGFTCIGTTPAATFGSVAAAKFILGGQIDVTRDNGTGIRVSRFNGDGAVLSVHSGSTQVGSISFSGSTTAYNTTSDERLKEDFADFDSASIVDAVKVYDFAWKDSDQRSLGSKAQELHAVFPQAVTPGHGEPGDEDFEPWGIDYSKLVPVLMREVQSLRERVAALEAKL